MATDTGYTLDQFLADTRATIKTKGVPSGLAEIRDHVEKLLRNPELWKKHLGDPVPYRERTTIGHDPETDVHVLVHGRDKGGKSVPHDHGPCWVIYGNYKNPTRMRRWRRLDDGSKPGHAELELQREFLNEPGRAAVSGRRGRTARPHRHDRADPRACPRGDRRRRSRGDAGLHRRPHPHGRADLLGSARHLVLLAWHHQRRDGQLRLHAGALRQGE